MILYFNGTWLCNGFLKEIKDIIVGLKVKTAQGIALDASLNKLAYSYSSLKPIEGKLFIAAIKNVPHKHYTIESITNSIQSIGYLTNYYKAHNANFYEKKIILKTSKFKIPSVMLEEPSLSIEKVCSEKKPIILNALAITTPIEDIDETVLNDELYHQKKFIDEEITKTKALFASHGQDPAIVDQVMSMLTDPDTLAYTELLDQLKNSLQH